MRTSRGRLEGVAPGRAAAGGQARGSGERLLRGAVALWWQRAEGTAARRAPPPGSVTSRPTTRRGNQTGLGQDWNLRIQANSPFN